MEKELTPQQSRFVDEYMIDLNATQAYHRAGYKGKGRVAENAASRLLGNVGVQNAIQERMKCREERTQITSDFVLHGIVKNIRRCEQVEPVTDRQGEPVMVSLETGEVAPQFKYDATNALKGYELLGKHLALWTDKSEVTVNGGKSLAELAQEARDESE